MPPPELRGYGLTGILQLASGVATVGILLRNRQNRAKRVSGSKNSHVPVSQQWALSQKFPLFLVEPCREMGIFWLKAPLSETLGNGSLLTPKASFPDFGDFDPCKGRTLSQKYAHSSFLRGGLRVGPTVATPLDSCRFPVNPYPLNSRGGISSPWLMGKKASLLLFYSMLQRNRRPPKPYKTPEKSPKPSANKM